MITIYASLKSLSNATLIRELCIPFKVGYTASNIYYDSKFSVDKYAVRQYTSVKIASTFTVMIMCTLVASIPLAHCSHMCQLLQMDWEISKWWLNADI